MIAKERGNNIITKGNPIGTTYTTPEWNCAVTRATEPLVARTFTEGMFSSFICMQSSNKFVRLGLNHGTWTKLSLWQLILLNCGDIETNPGPRTSKDVENQNVSTLPPCPVCKKDVDFGEASGLCCDECDNWIHPN